MTLARVYKLFIPFAVGGIAALLFHGAMVLGTLGTALAIITLMKQNKQRP